MTGTERRQFEMLVRVRNFGNTHPSLFASSPAAQKTFEALGATIDELTITDGRKLSAKASARGDRKAVARRALKDLLRRISVLARNLSAEGRTMPAFELPRSKSDVSLLTAARQFAVDAVPIDAELSAHGMGATRIAAMTDAFAAAVNDQGMGRSEHVRSTARLRDLVASGVRAVQRLDLVIGNELGHDNGVQAEWTQLRRLEDPRVTRGKTAERTPANGAVLATTPPEAMTPPSVEH